MCAGIGAGKWCTLGSCLIGFAFAFPFLHNSLQSAEPAHFEDGHGIQVIDASGDLLEWPDRSELHNMMFLYDWGKTPRPQGEIHINPVYDGYVEYNSPEPLGGFSFWPTQRPGGSRVWVKAADHLAMADDGQLFELRSSGLLLGLDRIYTTPATVIPFPPGVIAWSSFGSSYRLRTAVSVDGQFWAWDSHASTLPGMSTDDRDFITGTFGDNLSAPFEPEPNLSMFKIPAPSIGTMFLNVKFPMIPIDEPVTQPGNGIPGQEFHHVNAFVALTADGNLYQYGRHLEFTDAALPLGRHVLKTRTATPVVVPLPAAVSGWVNFEPARYRLYALGAEGDLYGWGDNTYGNLGNGTRELFENPVQIPKPPGVNAWRRVRATTSATLALGSNGKLYGWGELSPLRTALSGPPDARFDSDELSFLMLRPTPLNIGSESNHVVDFAVNRDSVVALLESGEIRTFFAYDHGYKSYVTPVSENEMALPNGTHHTVENRSPFVRLLSPFLLTKWSGIEALPILAEATDVDGSVKSVILFLNGIELGSMTKPDELYRLDWPRIPRGRYEIMARATDDQGATTDSVPVVLYVEREGPVISAAAGAEQGGMSFTVTGNEWAPGHVEWSNDLTHWHSLQNITFEESSISVIDTSPTTGNRFYRIRIEE